MTSQSDNPRYHGLDFLRAGMMLLGIVLHVSVSYIVRVEGAPPVPWPYADPDQTHAAFLLTGFIHLFRMPGFFLLAGFFAGLLIDKRGRRAFFGNRVMRILVPLLIGWVVLWPLTMLAGMLGVGMNQLPEESRSLASAFVAAAGMDPGVAPGTPRLDLIHLWFLHYLFLYCILALPIAWVLARPAGTVRTWLDHLLVDLGTGHLRWIRTPLLASLTFLLLVTSRDGLGIDTRTDLVPDPATFTTYFFFFLVGWILYAHREVLGAIESHAWTRTIAGVALLTLSMGFGVVQLALMTGPGGDIELGAAHWPVFLAAFFASKLLQAFGFWLFMFGIMGLAERGFRHANPTVRYLVDASYWIYLAHLPLTILVPVLIRDVPLPGILKLILAVVLVTIPLLVTYHFMVRATFIGRLLNGRRYARELPMRRSGATRTPVRADRT